MENDSTVEEMLKESMSIIETHPEDRTYKHLIHVINFLYFEYYHQLKLHKNAAKYFEITSANIETLFLFNHCSFVYHFLISNVEYFLLEKKEAELINEEDVYSHEPDINDISGFVLFYCYKASAEFYAEKYTAALQTLNKLINEVSFKNMSFPELEVKSFLAIINIICNRHDQAEINIRSISRKIADEDNEVKHHSAIIFLKLIKTATSIKTASKLEKITELNNLFQSTNNGKYAFLKHLKLNEKSIQLLAK